MNLIEDVFEDEGEHATHGYQLHGVTIEVELEGDEDAELGVVHEAIQEQRSYTEESCSDEDVRLDKPHGKFSKFKAKYMDNLWSELGMKFPSIEVF